MGGLCTLGHGDWFTTKHVIQAGPIRARPSTCWDYWKKVILQLDNKPGAAGGYHLEVKAHRTKQSQERELESLTFFKSLMQPCPKSENACSFSVRWTNDLPFWLVSFNWGFLLFAPKDILLHVQAVSLLSLWENQEGSMAMLGVKCVAGEQAATA